MSYENKFVNNTEKQSDSSVAFRLKQAQFTGQHGDVLFLSSKYPNAVLEGKKLSGEPDKDEGSCYNTYYFTEHGKKQFKRTREFAKKAGLKFLYFFYVTFGKGRKANFYVIPSDEFTDRIKETPATISLQEMKWFQLDSPWYKSLKDL